MAAPPLPLKVAGKVKLLAGTPKLPSFAQLLLLELLEVDELEEGLEALLTLNNEELNDELLRLLGEELEELFTLDDEKLEIELLILDESKLEEKLLTLDCEELKGPLFRLDEERLEEDVMAAALDVEVLVADDDATLATTELLELDIATRLDAILEDDDLLRVEDALLGDVVDGVKPESLLPPPPPPPHAVNRNINRVGVSSLVR